MAESSARPKENFVVDGVQYDSTKDMVEGVAKAKAGIKTITGTSYTVVSEDHGLVLDFTNGSAVTVTVPANLRPGFVTSISQGGAGQVTISAGAGVTLNEADSRFKTEKRYVVVTLVQFAANVYRVLGRTAA